MFVCEKPFKTFTCILSVSGAIFDATGSFYGAYFVYMTVYTLAMILYISIYCLNRMKPAKLFHKRQNIEERELSSSASDQSGVYGSVNDS